MRVKVKYEETIARETVIEIDDAEFLEVLNEAGPPHINSVDQVAGALGEDLDQVVKEYLEDGDPDEWATYPGKDPLETAYDQHLLEVEVLDS